MNSRSVYYFCHSSLLRPSEGPLLRAARQQAEEEDEVKAETSSESDVSEAEENATLLHEV